MKPVQMKIVAILCLLAFVLGGQMNVCACSLVEAPAQSCSGHEHSGENDGHNKNGSDEQCPCVACHSCQHVPVVIPCGLAVLPSQPTAELVALISPNTIVFAAEIFTPPKLG